MAISDDDMTTTPASGEGVADGGSNPGGHDGGADGSAHHMKGEGEGLADGGSNPDGHDGGADGSADGSANTGGASRAARMSSRLGCGGSGPC